MPNTKAPVVKMDQFKFYIQGETILRIELKSSQPREVFTGIYIGERYTDQRDKKGLEGVMLALSGHEEVHIKLTDIRQVQAVSRFQLLAELRKLEAAQGEE